MCSNLFIFYLVYDMNSTSYSNTRLITLVVISQFACTSLWFAGNAVVSDIIKEYQLDLRILSHIVTAVQLGFISGTLLFSVFTISDRFSPSKVFFISAIAGALANLLVFMTDTAVGIILSRFITGFCLAGIYPVGMKIAADYHEKGLGKALGFLVGALVLGTAFPHLLKTIGASFPWRYVMVCTSAMAVAGGLLILFFVPDGPHRVRAGKPDFSLCFKLFSNKDFLAATTGYFGHMWELYAFWAFVPVIITTYNTIHPQYAFHVPVYSFLIIGAGGLSCMVGGLLSLKYGNVRVAAIALLISGLCCLVSPFLFGAHPALFIAILLVWGLAVVTDSPQFTTLVATAVQPAEKGTALTIVNTIGFAITVVSIQVINALIQNIGERYIYLVLAAGPIAGLVGLRRLLVKK